MPRPAFSRPPVPSTAPESVAVPAKPGTVSVRREAPKATGPESVIALAAATPPSETLPLIVTALPTVRAAEPAISETPSASASVPVPSGPLVTGVPVEARSRISVPAATFSPLVKVLAPERTSEPVPVFWIWPPAEVIGAEMIRPIGERPETLSVGVAFESASPVTETIGVVAGLSLTTVIGLAAERVSVPAVTAGVVVPPMPLKVSAFRVLVPTSVSTPPPLTVTLAVEAIWPALVFIVTRLLSPAITRLPGITTEPAAPERFTRPVPLANVVPV